MTVAAACVAATLALGGAPDGAPAAPLRQADVAVAWRCWAAADSLFRAAIRAQPSSAEPWIRYIRHLRRRDRWLALDSLARHAVAVGPPGVEGRCVRALALIGARGAEPAMADSAVAWQADPGARLCVAFALAEAAADGDLPPAHRGRAEAYLEDLVRRAPEMARAYDHLARYLEQDGRTEEALAVVAEGLGRAGLSPLGRVRLQEARIRLLRGRDPEAALALERRQDAALRRSGLPELHDASRHHRARAAARRATSPGEAEQAWRSYTEDGTVQADPGRVAWDLLEAGMEQSDAGRYDRSLPLFRAALARASEAGLAYPLGRAHWRVGRDLLALGRAAEAESHLLEAARIADAYGLLNLAAEAAHNLAHLREAGPDDQAAAEAYDRFIERSERLGRRSPLHLVALRDAAEFHRRHGRLATAARLFDRLIARIDAADAEHYWAAEYLESRGEIGRAIRYYERSLRHGGSEANRARGALARLAALEGRDADAERLARAHDAAGPAADGLPLLPSILASRGAHLQAARELERWAGRKARSGDLRGVYRATLARVAALLDGGDIDGAGAALERIRRPPAHANLGGLPDRERLLQARIELARRRPGRADSLLRSVVERAALQEDAELAIDAGTLLGRALLRQGRTDDALAVLDLTARRADTWSASVTDPIRAVHLRGRVAEPIDLGLRALLHEARPDIPRILAWSARRKAVSWGRAEEPTDPLEPGSTPDGWLVLDYITVGPEAWVAAVDRDSATLRRLDIATPALDSLVSAVTSPFMAVNSGQIDLARLSLDRTAARRLYRALIRPVEPRLEAASGLLVVPDGSLFGLPFGLLRPGPEARYLVEETAIAYALDARAATRLPGPRAPGSPGPGPFVIVGGEAPGAADEVGRVAGILDGTPILSPSGTTLLQRLHGAGVVHLAVHAEGDPRDPRSTQIVLGDPDDPAGILDLARLGQVDIAAELVFLSACSTARGSRGSGSGVLSLASAFLDAGARAVVATHWPVGAEAGLVAETFYDHWWTRGSTMPDALRAARLTLLRDPATADPFYWAPFALYVME